MTAVNPFVSLLPKINPKPDMIPSDGFKDITSMDKEALTLFQKAGVTAQMLQKTIEGDIKVAYDRFNIYSEVERACEHWFIGPALDLYANVSTVFSSIRNCTCWVTSKSETYRKELSDLFDRIGLEEKIYDWAYSIGLYGDLMAKVNGAPGLGIISLEDGIHPMNVSRLEYDGVLIGFYDTPQGLTQRSAFGIGNDSEKQQLIPPWEYVHFRLLGAKRRRPRASNDSSQAEMKSVNLITGSDTRQVTTKYGTSLLINAIPAYKRLRLAEDSILLSRLTRGIVKYIWKCKVDMSNMEAASSMIDQYATLITQARAVDTGSNPKFDSKNNSLTAIEDIFVPVWGDVGDLAVEKIGESPDIRWIVDVDNLRNQLAFALACSPSLGGAFTKESSGALGSEAISELGIRFARSARRLQRALISGIIRICQIHLAYMGYDPDPDLFEVHMSETSTAEEGQLMKSLQTGINSFNSFMKTMKVVAGNKVDALKVWEYFNEKIIRLEDFDIMDFMKSPEVLAKEAELRAKAELQKQGVGGVPPEKKLEPGIPTDKIGKESIEISGLEDEILFEQIQEAIERKKLKEATNKKKPVFNLDIISYLPLVHSSSKLNESKSEDYPRSSALVILKDSKNEDPNKDWLFSRDAAIWESKFGTAYVSEGIEETTEQDEKDEK